MDDLILPASTVLCGDVRERIQEIPDGSVQCVVTSPPYYGLRSYDGGDAEIGHEETPQAYVDEMVQVFREVRRVLADDGTLWLNLGSTYASGTMESEEYVLRDDLTEAERAHVYAELAKHFEAKSEAVPEMRPANASPERDVSVVLQGSRFSASELCDEGV